MAQNDIDIGIGLKLDESDLKQTVKKVSDVAAQIDKIWEHAADTMRRRLVNSRTNPVSMGFADIEKSVEDNFRVLEKVMGRNLPKASRKSVLRYYDKQGGSNSLLALEALERYAKVLAPYGNVYKDIANLQNKTSKDEIEPSKALGWFGVLRQYMNRFSAKLYRGNLLFPGVVTQDALETGEFFRDMNLKNGITNRKAMRYILEQQYKASTVNRAADYMLLTGESGLDLLNSIYGLGLGTGTTTIPKRTNKSARDSLSLFSYFGLRAQEHKEALLGGGLTKEERDYHLSAYKEDMKAFISLQKKLFPEEKAIAENLKKLNRSDLLTFGGGSGGGIERWLKGAGSAGSIAGVTRGIIDIIESKWGESITRSVYGSKMAYTHRLQTGGGIAGGLGGGVLGGISVGAAMGSMGGWNWIGAAIGAAVGAAVGPVYGKLKEIETQANMKSTDSMIARVRNKAMFGAGYNTYFANTMATLTGGDGMAELANQGMSLRARMMLGQVGEYDMLFYSMMPNYYAALMEGKTGPELAKIYQRDLNSIGDPSMRYVAGQAIGGQNAYAMANSPYFNAIYSSIVGRARQYETAAMGLAPGYMSARTRVGLEDIGIDYGQILRTAQKGGKDFFLTGFEDDRNLRALRTLFGGGGKNVIDRNTGESITFVNVINIDGEQIKKETKTADEIYIDSWGQYAGGN